MMRRLRATLIFVTVVAGLIWATNAVIERTTGLWVARDNARRVQFALRASGSALVEQWRWISRFRNEAVRSTDAATQERV